MFISTSVWVLRTPNASFFFALTCITSFQCLSITCNAFIACCKIPINQLFTIYQSVHITYFITTGIPSGNHQSYDNEFTLIQFHSWVQHYVYLYTDADKNFTALPNSERIKMNKIGVNIWLVIVKIFQVVACLK